MMLRPFEEHIFPEYGGSGNMMRVASDSLSLKRGFLGVKIDIDHGISISTPSNQFFMFPEPSRYRTVRSVSVKPDWVQ